MGRSLSNNVYNLGIRDQYAEALTQLGFNLERLVEQFYGKVEEEVSNDRKRWKWIPGEMVEAVAYDNPIPGYDTGNTINLRLWAAKPSGESDLGKELRLKQQYFFVSASLQDIMRRFKDFHSNFDEFPDKVALQLNDTHPSIAVAELMRMLVDEENVEWKRAWGIVKKVFSFTNHTVVPEALEKIPVELLESLLPRHLQIIYDINFFFLEDLRRQFGSNYDRLARMSIIEEGAVKSVRMATLSIVACHTVNGVSQVHSEILRTTLFKVHRMNKSRLAEYIQEISGLTVSIDAMFDVQVKRIHEYKRQFLNVLSIIHRCDCIKNMTSEEKKKVVPRVCLIGGKAAPGYEIAKKIIKLIHAVSGKINSDPEIGNLLKLFIFGAKVHEVSTLRDAKHDFQPPREFTRVIRMIRNGYFGFQDYFQSLCDTVDGEGEDFYLLGNDFASYLEAQAAADRTFIDQEKWTRMSIISTAGSGKFSSDRTIKEYAEQAWGIEPCKRPC